MPTDVRGRSSRERLVHHVATPETIRKLDNVTIDRLYANGFLRGEHVDAWLEIHDAWKALSRGLGWRLMHWEEKTSSSKGGGEISARLERLISKYSDWHSTVAREQHEIVIATIEGHALREMVPNDEVSRKTPWDQRFMCVKMALKGGLHEYCLMDGTV